MVEIDTLMKGEMDSRKLKLIDEVMSMIEEEFDRESPAVIRHNFYSIRHSNRRLRHADIVAYLVQLKYRIKNNG